MSKIITLTFSPCIDKSTSVATLMPEKKMACSLPMIAPGGGGINVSRALKILGVESTAIFPSGGYSGKIFNQLLQDEHINSVIVETTSETRENIIVLDESTHLQYRFGMPGTHLSENEWKNCLNAFSDFHDISFIIASGSLPPGVPLDIYAQIAKIVKINNAKFVVDTSGEALRQAVTEGVYLLKPNLAELSGLTGKENIELKDVEANAKIVVNEYPCEVVVVSLGREGALLITKTETYRARAPKVNIKSTVGAGDSMVAGIVYGIFRGMNLKQSLHYGVACGTAATLNEGTQLCKKEDVESIFKNYNFV